MALATVEQKVDAHAFSMAAQQCTLDGLHHLARMGCLVISISDLVHALQRERGASNLYIASGGNTYKDDLDKLVAAAEANKANFYRALGEVNQASVCGFMGARLLRRIAYVLDGMATLPEIRVQVKAQALVVDAVVKSYSELIQSLLAVVFEAADTAVDEPIARLLVAMFHLMQGKELAGQERATVVAGFAAGLFNAQQKQRLPHLIDGQEKAFNAFLNYADESAVSVWQVMQQEQFQLDVERLRRVALTAGKKPVKTSLASVWFEQCSARIDAIKLVEEALETSLLQLCQARILVAKEALDQPSQPYLGMNNMPSFAVYFSEYDLLEASMNEVREEHVFAPNAQPVQGGIGHSIIGLLQAQTQRMQDMNAELDAAKTALHERKTIDSAKQLLMQHRQLSEPDAYKLLRQMAMNQGKRLVDIAEATLAMEAVLRTR